MTSSITEHKKVITVKNAKLFYDYDHKRLAFRLVHYYTEILTVKANIIHSLEPIRFDIVNPKIVYIYPVSDASKRAIQEALFYIFKEYKDIDQICEQLGVNRRILSTEFWGFDPFKKYMTYNPNRPSTFNEAQKRHSLKRFNKESWTETIEKLELTELPNYDKQPVEIGKKLIGDHEFEAKTFVLNQSSIKQCPHFILDPTHYYNDDTCKCNDPNNMIMKEWGYKWNKVKGMWN